MNSIRFLHIRATADDKLLPHGGKTIAFTVSGHNPEGQRLLRFAVAKCGKKQAFSRKLGREVAEGMLTCERPAAIEKHVKTIMIDDDTHPYEALRVAGVVANVERRWTRGTTMIALEEQFK